MSLRDLLVSLRDQHDAERRLEQQKSDRRTVWEAAYEQVASAFSVALAPFVAEGLLEVENVKQALVHPDWGECAASVLTFEASGKRAELRPVNELCPGYVGQARLVRSQVGKRSREVTLYLFASASAPAGWQFRLSDLQGVYMTDVVSRADTVFAPMTDELIQAALEKVLAN